MIWMDNCIGQIANKSAEGFKLWRQLQTNGSWAWRIIVYIFTFAVLVGATYYMGIFFQKVIELQGISKMFIIIPSALIICLHFSIIMMVLFWLLIGFIYLFNKPSTLPTETELLVNDTANISIDISIP